MASTKKALRKKIASTDENSRQTKNNRKVQKLLLREETPEAPQLPQNGHASSSQLPQNGTPHLPQNGPASSQEMQVDGNLEPGIQPPEDHEEDSKDHEDEIDSGQEDENSSAACAQNSQGIKRKRGKTKMNKIALDPKNRVDVQWTEFGQPYEAGSVSLSSYLGPLVREVVPVTLPDWRKLSNEHKEILWKSIKV